MWARAMYLELLCHSSVRAEGIWDKVPTNDPGYRVVSYSFLRGVICVCAMPMAQGKWHWEPADGEMQRDAPPTSQKPEATHVCTLSALLWCLTVKLQYLMSRNCILSICLDNQILLLFSLLTDGKTKGKSSYWHGGLLIDSLQE